MSVKQVLENKPYAKIASEVVLEKEINELKNTVELMMKVIENMTSRLDYLESRQ